LVRFPFNIVYALVLSLNNNVKLLKIVKLSSEKHTFLSKKNNLNNLTFNHGLLLTGFLTAQSRIASQFSSTVIHALLTEVHEKLNFF